MDMGILVYVICITLVLLILLGAGFGIKVAFLSLLGAIVLTLIIVVIRYMIWLRNKRDGNDEEEE